MPQLQTTVDPHIIDVLHQHDVQQKPSIPRPNRTEHPQPAATCSNNTHQTRSQTDQNGHY